MDETWSQWVDAQRMGRANKYIPECIMDTMLAGYLLNYPVKDDPAYLANNLNYEIPLYDKKVTVSSDEYIKRSINVSAFIYHTYDDMLTKMKDNNVLDLYKKIELPLSTVLAKMESKMQVKSVYLGSPTFFVSAKMFFDCINSLYDLSKV